jgi:hypothetical protein
MSGHCQRGVLFASMCVIGLASLPVSADEIRLKDGKKLNGVIVGYEENMFKVKTDFGFVLVEKDKIASIIPSGSANSEAAPGAKSAADSNKGGGNPQTKPDATSSSGARPTPTTTNASVKAPISGAPENNSAAPKIAATLVKPNVPSNGATGTPSVPSLNSSVVASSPVATAAPSPAPPKEPEVPVIREDVQGNLYTNYTHGFRMYKAPSWQLIDDARNALPNAIVAMGTSNESSLMVIGREKTKESLDSAAVAVEARLHDVYENYQRVSQHKTTVGNSPAVEFRYRGKADEHDWSGTLVVISHGGDIFTVLGMTYADSDLIQIQENVIAKTIGSLSFELPEAKK